MTYGSVCSGIEAATVACRPLGWRAAWFAEIEPFPSAVLAHHYPHTPNLGDMTTIAARVLAGDVPAPDVFVGGTPCQAFSVAGHRNSLADERGNLTLRYVELADAIDHVRRRNGRPECIAWWENVPGVLSTGDNAFGCFLGALAGAGGELQPAGKRWSDAGCVYGPARAVAWRILDAQYFGLAQRRRRVFVVASARNGFDPAQVLLERDSLRRDSAPRRQAREAVAGSLAASAGHHGYSSPRGDGSDNLIASPLLKKGCSASYDTAELLCVATGQAAADMGADMAPTLSCNHEAPYIVGTLQASWKAAGRDAAAGLLVPAYSIRTAQTSSNGWGIQEEVTHTLDQAQGVAVAFDTTQITSPANRSHPTAGDPCHPLAAGAKAPPIAFDCKASDPARATGAIAPTMRAMGSASGHANGGGQLAVALAPGMQVRRLTPRECERLQGFPDDYTRIDVRGKPAADGPRYKALGNSMAVPVMAWIGRRIHRGMAAAAEPA